MNTMIKLDSKLRDKFKASAKKRGYTLQGLLEKLIKEYLNKNKPEVY